MSFRFSRSFSRLSFNDPEPAFAHKSFFELTRSLLILKACSYPWIVNNSAQILHRARSLLGDQFVLGLVERTLFTHFCAGKEEASVMPTVERLGNMGVGAILDYAAEADVSEVGKSQLENAEKMCEENVKFISHSIETAKKVAKGIQPFTAMKVTAIGRTEVLERASTIQVSIRNLFHEIDKNNDGFVSLVEFEEAIQKLHLDKAVPNVSELFKSIDVRNANSFDLIDWESYFDGHKFQTGSNPFFAVTESHPRGVISSLTNDEIQGLEKVRERLDTLADLAFKNEVHLMVDAEQTYFQPIIDNLVVNVQKKFNRNSTVLFSTFQCYLVDSFDRLKLDMNRAKRGSWKFATKLVRGAYMDSERHRAFQLRYSDPIHPSIQLTHANYHKCLSLLLDNLSFCEVLIASHNQTTIEFAIDEITLRKLSKDQCKGIYFAQLYGMGEHLTSILSANGYQAYKYLPFGPVSEVLPYLLRRSVENASFLGGAIKERQMLWDEYKRRYGRSFLLVIFALICLYRFVGGKSNSRRKTEVPIDTKKPSVAASSSKDTKPL